MGPWVEACSDFFVEGVWPGEFADAAFPESYAFMGSGVAPRDDQLMISAPCHTIECLYSIGEHRRTIVSNSLSFLLLESTSCLDLSYPNHDSDIMSIRDGLHSYRRTIPLKSGVVRIHFFCNLLIDRHGTLLEVPKARPTLPLNTYDAYMTFLRRALHAMKKNLESPQRLIAFSPIVFSSNGYESPACAVLAQELGCDTALVFETSRSLRTDSGFDVLSALGYSRIEQKKDDDYTHYDRAHEFVSSGDLGTSDIFQCCCRRTYADGLVQRRTRGQTMGQALPLY